MKTLLSLLGVAILAFALVGCGSSGGTEPLNLGSDIEASETDVATEQEETVVEEPVAVEANSEESEATTSESEAANSDGPTLTLMEYLPDGRGTDIYFEDYKGKMLFVNFFGTWCTYCIKEMPDFQSFTEDYADQATIVIVNALETEKIDMAGVVEWYEESGYTMQMVFDEDRSKTADFYGAIQGYPTTFVFDENQEFLGYIPGMMDYNMLEGIVLEYGPQ